MTKKIGILGASGYTGAELVRLIATHPEMEIAALAAGRKAGRPLGQTFPQLAHLELPVPCAIGEVDYSGLDLVFLALPHGIAHELVPALPEGLKIVDLSADFRLRDPAQYEYWYGQPHRAAALQPDVAFGLPEFYRDEIAAARIAANTGCYVATSLLPLVPLLRAGAIAPESIVIDAKSGVSGAGRALREGSLFCEVNEGFAAYGVGHHRHMGELDQELSRAAGRPVHVTFTPHLVPMNRGMMATIYAAGDASGAQAVLARQFAAEPFVSVLELGKIPATAHIRGSNRCHIGVVADRAEGRMIIVSVLDNLMKGASGQAVQIANIMLGLPETAGLALAPMFP